MTSRHDTHRYERVMEIVDSLLDCEPGDLEARLREECGGDESLSREVRELLAEDKPASGFLEESPLKALPLLATDEEEDRFIGKQIGAYRITEEIGRGGMGAVYKAVRADDQYTTEVAIKLIKRGMDTDFVLRRFRNERQILANLNHPSIARLLDGGSTEDGLPYFVMEYIEGLPIDKYLETRQLSITGRLKLFLTVCSAVQFAHQNLVVHRDLKPSNIIVTAEGSPKLLDFGIAKILRLDSSPQKSEATATIFRIMTPEYASPEQIKGEPITTATDVYSLGVVLYELLSGQRPYTFRSRRPADIAEAICDKEPEKPSAAAGGQLPSVSKKSESAHPARANDAGAGPQSPMRSRQPGSSAGVLIHDPQSLRGDLDNIVLMALRKEPQRRYASVSEFSEDIRRHLEGLPVRARQDTFAYRASKFLKRNKLAVAAAAIISLTLLGGIVATTWQARVARSERARAEHRFNEVRKLARAVLFDYHDAIANLSGSTPVRERLVKDALEYLDSLSQDAGDDITLRQELATAYIKVGDVQGRQYTANLGQTDGALTSYRKALAILEPLAASDPASLEVQRNLAIAYERVGTIRWRKGDIAESLERNQKALTIREALFAADPSNDNYRRALADSYYSFAGSLAEMCQSSASLECARQVLPIYLKALEIRESLAQNNPSDPELRRELAKAYMRVGFELANTSEGKAEYLRQALESHGKALAIQEELALANPDNAFDRRNVADQSMLRSDSQVQNGDVIGSLVGYRKALAIFKELSAADPSNAEARLDLSFALTKLGAVEIRTGNLAAARKHYAEALPVVQRLLADDPNVEAMQVMQSVYVALSDLSEKAGDLSGAIENCRKAVDLNEWFETIQSFPHLPADLARHCQRMGELYARSAKQARNGQRVEKWRTARAWFQKSLERWQEARNKGSLTANYADRPDQVAREIAKCDLALQK